MLKLTQCLIVKNEEKNLMRALGWGKGLFDELIVVDTGSSDGTVSLAQRLGAKVISFDWVDDFSAARNFAISECTGDWIFFLDADEYFEDDDAALLRPLIEKIEKSCTVVKGKKTPYNVVETPWINLGNEGFSVSRQARIFKNTPDIRYTGAVHEQLHALNGGSLNVYTIEDKPAIYHTGYVWTNDNSKAEKGLRNFETAKKALEKSPDSAKLRLFAAEALYYQGRYREAEEYFSEAMKNKDGSVWPERAREGYKQWLNSYIIRQRSGAETAELINCALRVRSEAAEKFPDDADFDILMSLIFFKAKDIINTIRFFNASLPKKAGRFTESLKSSGDTYKQLRALCEELSPLISSMEKQQ